jgi:O-antigen/teichoic acid export membrane protein
MIDKLKSKLSQDLHLSELIKGSTVSFFYKLIGMFFGYIFSIIVARWYGADTMGMYALSLTVLNIFVTIGVFGFDNALVKFITEYRTQKRKELVKEVYKKSLYFSLIVSLSLSLFLYFNAGNFAVLLFKNIELTPYFKIAAIGILPFSIIKLNSAVFRGHKDIKFFSFFQSVSILFIAILILTILHLIDEDKKYTILSHIIAIIVSFILSIYYIDKKYSMQLLSKNSSLLKFKEIVKVSFPMLLTSSMVLMIGWSDTLMLGYFQTTNEVGIYSVVYKISLFAIFMQGVVASISMPKFSEIYSKKDFKLLNQVVYKSTIMTLLSSLTIILILIFFGEYILSLFGNEFTVGYSTLIVLLIGSTVSIFCGPVGTLMNVVDEEKMLFYLLFTSAILNILLNLYMIPTYGYLGAAVSSSFSILFWNIFAVFYLRKKNIHTQFRIQRGKK